MSSRLNLYRVLTAGWMTLIFVLSSQPSLPAVSLFSGADLLAHAVVFGILGALLSRSLAPSRVTAWRRVLLITMLVAVYGITDEYHQSFVPGRDASAWDVLADGLGGLLAAAILFWRERRTVTLSRVFSPVKEGEC